MKKHLLISILLPLISFSQKKYVLKLEEPVVDNKMKVVSKGCKYTSNDIYIINKNNVVYENCTELETLYPDMDSFYVPKDNFKNYFALDKYAVYFRGERIKIGSKGFEIIGFDRVNYQIDKVYWKTDKAVYKNNEKLTVYADPLTLINLRSTKKWGVYYKDKYNVYYKETKIKNADPKTFKNTYGDFDFAYDKNNSYLEGEIVTYNNEKITLIKYPFYKTNKHILKLNDTIFVNIPHLDVNSFKLIDTEYISYYFNKNRVYHIADTLPLPIKKENFKNIKAWSFSGNREYLSDGENVFFKGEIEKDLDANSFGILKDSSYFYDKKGIFERTLKRKLIKGEVQSSFINEILPFKYSIPIQESNAFTSNTGYVIYENQAYNRHFSYPDAYFKNLTAEEVQLAKQNKLVFNRGKPHTVIEKDFDYKSGELYKSNNKIYYQGIETTADANTFKRINDSILFHVNTGSFDIYKDSKNVYWHDRDRLLGGGLFILEGINTKTVEIFNDFFKDNNFLYYNNKKIIKSKDIEILGIYDAGISRCCGAVVEPKIGIYYLLKNFEGYWLVGISNKVVIRNLGRRLKNNWKERIFENSKID